VPRVVAPPQHVALSASLLLEGLVVVVMIYRPCFALHALFVAPLILDRNGAVDELAKGLVLARLQSLAKVVVRVGAV
jgi:hypothetical protein